MALHADTAKVERYTVMRKFTEKLVPYACAWVAHRSQSFERATEGSSTGEDGFSDVADVCWRGPLQCGEEQKGEDRPCYNKRSYVMTIIIILLRIHQS